MIQAVEARVDVPVRSSAGPRRAQSPSWARFAVVFGGAAAVVAALFAAARALAPVGGPIGVAGSIVSGLAAMILMGSLAEWWIHGRSMHRKTPIPVQSMIVDLHVRAHHWTHYRPDSYLRAEVTHAPILASRPERVCLTRREDLTAIASQAAYYSAFAAPVVVASWLVTANVAFFAALTFGLVALIFLAIHLHDAVHAPGMSPLERFRWFRWVDRHHYIHHIDAEANCNFVIPLADWLLGTLRTELTQDELARWPSYATVVAGVPARR